MSDPEGNEFCILQSIAPRQSDHDLPFVDEHGTLVAASAETVWQVLLDHLDRQFSRSSSNGVRVCCRLCRRRRVGTAAPRRRLDAARLSSRCPLSRSPKSCSRAVIGSRPTVSRSESISAAGVSRGCGPRPAVSFPGVAGECYRRVVIASGGHAILLRRLLSGVRRKSTLV